MAYQNHQRSRETWALARKQHGVVTRGQLLELGFTPQAILHRIRIGRLHPVWRGVYAAGRPSLTQHGRWMAAVLACGPDALLSHLSAAALWEIHEGCGGLIHVSVPRDTSRRRPGIATHRRSMAANEFNHCQWIPVTGPVTTLVDLAATLDVGAVESAIREA